MTRDELVLDLLSKGADTTAIAGFIERSDRTVRRIRRRLGKSANVGCPCGKQGPRKPYGPRKS